MMVYIPKGVPLAWGKGPKGLPNVTPAPIIIGSDVSVSNEDATTYAEYCGHFHEQEESMGDHSLKFFFDDLCKKYAPELSAFSEPKGDGYRFFVNKFAVTRILKSGPYTHVFWADGTKTSVRRSPDEEDNDYAAFTAALAIKMYGSNSALKRMLKEKVEVQKPKKKSTECTDTCPIDYDAIYRELSAKIEHLENGDAT